MGYLWQTRDHKLVGVIKDYADNLFLSLYVDANFCGDTDNTRSTSGAWLELSGPKGTKMPLAHVVKRQLVGRSQHAQ